MPERNIRVHLYQNRPIPLEVDFSCKKNEILVIVGPSGSGKTTILRSICGLFQPASGKIICNGRTWFDSDNNVNIPVQHRPAGMMFQHYALFPHLSAQNNVMLASRPNENPKRKTKSEELLSLVHMNGLEARYPHELSGGQQQRVALARALAREPEVLLLDEPFSAVDQQTRRKLLRELIRLRHQLNIPIILVTHDLDEARVLADKMCVIHHGKTLQTDTPDTLMTRPVSAEVARLVGLENVFEAVIDRHDAASQRTFIKWDKYILETPYRPQFAPGMSVNWAIPAGNIILHRKDRPSKGERENPVKGEVEELMQLGETSSVTAKIKDSQQLLTMTIPTHVARRNGINIRTEISVSLLSDGIHLMEKLPATVDNRTAISREV